MDWRSLLISERPEIAFYSFVIKSVNMTKFRAIVNQGPEVVRNAVKVVTAKSRAKVNEFLADANPFRPTVIVAPVQPKRNLELSVERFRYEWGKGKPGPDEFRKDLEKGYEFGK